MRDELLSNGLSTFQAMIRRSSAFKQAALAANASKPDVW